MIKPANYNDARAAQYNTNRGFQLGAVQLEPGCVSWNPEFREQYGLLSDMVSRVGNKNHYYNGMQYLSKIETLAERYKRM